MVLLERGNMSDETTAEPKGSFLLRMISALAPDPKSVAAWVAEVRRENPNLDTDAVAEYLSNKVVWTYTSQGAALALPGAVPGLGTIVQVGIEAGAIGTDVALMVRNQTYLAFALAECYGIEGRDTLLQDVLLSIGLWSNALVLTKSGAIMIGGKVAAAAFKKKFPAVVLKRINTKVGVTILTKYGTKRGGIALGRMIPLGVGVAVGGSFNYVTMKAYAASARRYFSLKAK